MPPRRRAESQAAFRTFALLALLLTSTLYARSQNPATAPKPPPTPTQSPTPDPTNPDPTNPDQDADGLPSLNGLASTQNATLLDGVSTTQSFSATPIGTGADPAPDPDGDADSADQTTGPTNGLARGRHAGAAYLFSQSAIREFSPSRQTYSVQTGSAGSVSATFSRAGTQDLHGSLFYLLRSQIFAATNPLAVVTTYSNGVSTNVDRLPVDLHQNVAATCGRTIPLTTNFTIFESIDLQRRNFPAISSPADPNFYSLTPIQSALLAHRGLNPNQINAGLTYLASLTGPTPRSSNQTANFLRIDRKPNPISHIPVLSLEYNLVRWSAPAGLIEAPVVPRARNSIGNSQGSLDLLLLRIDTHNHHLNNNIRTSFLRDLQYETPQTPLPQEPSISPNNLAPEVNIGPNGLLFGTPANLSQQAYPDEHRVQLGDTITLTRGRHLFTLGLDASFLHDQVATLANPSGTFRYDSGITNGHAGGLVDFLTDNTFNVNNIPNGACPSITATTHNFCFRSFTQSFGETQTNFSTQDWAAFLEDTWHPKPHLTLHAGLRYEYTLLPLPNTPNQTLDRLFGSIGATSIFPEDRNNLGPRVALAWDPFGSGRLTVHLGYGVFFGRIPGATVRSALTQTALPTSTISIHITPTTITACPQNPSNGFGYPCAFNTIPTGLAAQTASAMLFDRHFRLPTVQQASLGIERPIHRRTYLSATYTMNLDRQLPTSTDLNIAPSTQTEAFHLQGGTGSPGAIDGETFNLPVYTSRITPTFGPVTDIVSHVNATYNGVTFALISSPVPNLQLHARYTWSKSIDFGQAQSAIPRTNAQFDPFNNRYDKALSGLNYPWTTHFTAVWTPTTIDGSRWLRHLTANWQFDPILTARAGRPYSLDLSGGTALAGGYESINGSGGALYLPTVGRNTLRLPATVIADLRLVRTFRAGPHTNLQASAEVFNLTNRRNISSVSERAYLIGTPVNGVTPLVFQNAANIAVEGLNTQPFGTPTSAATSLARERRIQFSLRLEF